MRKLIIQLFHLSWWLSAQRYLPVNSSLDTHAYEHLGTVMMFRNLVMMFMSNLPRTW